MTATGNYSHWSRFRRRKKYTRPVTLFVTNMWHEHTTSELVVTPVNMPLPHQPHPEPIHEHRRESF